MKISNLIKLLILLLLCNSCISNHKKNEQEVNALFRVIKERVEYTHENICIRDKLGVIPRWDYFEELQEDVLGETSDFLFEEDLHYIKEQQKDKQYTHWSQTDIITDCIIVDTDNVSKSDQVFSQRWWKVYKEKYDAEDIRIFSYPLFNANHDLAFITYHKLSSIVGNGTVLEIWIFRKNENGKWKYLSGGLNY